MSTAFRVANEDPNLELKRVEALEVIVKKSCDRDRKVKYQLGNWSVPKDKEPFMKEGNNMMIMNRLVSNVFVKWDKDWKSMRTITQWNSKIKELEEQNNQKGKVTS